MATDFVDHLVTQWRAARPDLDPEPMALVARLARLGALLERRLAGAVATHGLSVGEFDVLATLRRNEASGLSPKRLLEEILLSSGAMTHRIDRLEAAGLVERRPDPADRRGVIVRLTRQGRAVVDPAVADRFEDARQVTSLLPRDARRALTAGMRRLLVALEQEISE